MAKTYPNEALTDVCKMLLDDWDLDEEQVAALATDLAKEFLEHMMARNEAAWERRYGDLAESGGADDSHYRETMKAAGRGHLLK
jgi:hypothetical protein